jgi:biopolymer transport protein TolQ
MAEGVRPEDTPRARHRQTEFAPASRAAGFSVERRRQSRQLFAPLPMPASLPVTPFLAANIIEIFERCGTIDKVIVLGLGVCSLVAWTVMFGKHAELRRLRVLNLSFEMHLRDQRALVDVPESWLQRRSIPYADVFADALESYRRAAAFERERGQPLNPRARLEQAENAIQRAIGRQTLRYESNMIFLASIVSGAPFIGLLGTVWGVMEAFSAVATQQTAGIQQLAPGVSGAMLATIAGLVVAIPSVFGYNLLLGHTRRMITELENYASALADRIELEMH